MDISIIVSTYQRPEHLRRCLLSLENQRDVEGEFEVIVTDDGSEDSTLDMLSSMAKSLAFPLSVSTHRHNGFQLSRCRNEGVALSRAPYILITDGDCILPPDHVACHLRHRKPGFFVAGDCYRLSEAASEMITDDRIADGSFVGEVEPEEVKRIKWKAWRALAYTLLPFQQLPRLTGCNIGVWREDLEQVNGFDEKFVGWGYEDRDLQRRLFALGRRCRTILHRTAAYHLWHPPAPSFAPKGIGTANRDYFYEFPAEMRCEKGLDQRLPLTRNWLTDGEYSERQESEPRILKFPGRIQPRRRSANEQVRRAA